MKKKKFIILIVYKIYVTSEEVGYFNNNNMCRFDNMVF